MTKLKAMLFGAYVLGLGSIVASTANAGNALNHAGPYVEFFATGLGVELDGSHNDSNGEVSTGVAGKVAIIGGGAIGYNAPAGENMFVTVGASWNPGKAIFDYDNVQDATGDTSTSDDVTFEVSNHVTLFLAPSVAISDTAAFFFKLGYARAKTTVSGDVSEPANLSGITLAVGTTSQSAGGIFVKTEAGITNYGEIEVDGLGNTINTSTKVQADPTIAFGTISIGYKF